ncbi:NADPH-dependent FMN reductase [Sphingobacterium cellulitidis]|uniref:NADPH-dependent FMN reductase n=1 Tax=Sphingobacterium cellulitidis TaxID=1768011 RepID=UPI00370D8CEC
MKILAFGASNSSDSINKKLVSSVSKYYKEIDDEILVLDINNFPVPIFSKDLEKEIGIPENAVEFATKIDWADLILISFAENNGNYNVGYKNLYDWISRIKGRKVYPGKPVFLLSTSDGPRGAKTILEMAEARMPRDGATVLETFSLPDFQLNFEEGKGIIAPLLRSQLEAKVRKTKRLMAERLSNEQQ